MRLDEDFILKLLVVFEEHDDPFLPVPLLAQKAGDAANLEDENCLVEDPYTISNKLVFHLLHLQDIDAIASMNGLSEWGYYPFGNGGDLEEMIGESLKSGNFNSPHCYNCHDAQAIIRLTSTGIQIRTALQSEVEDNVKKAVIEFGKLAIPSALGALLGL